jgi:RluA family pseudouridine synthase
MAEFPKVFLGTAQDAGKRLDQYLAGRLAETSRARIQRLVAAKKVLVNGVPAKPSLRLRGAEEITILGAIESPALRAIPEEIPLDIVYQDEDLVVVNKPAGMMVHAGAGATEDARNRGTLVNALLHRFGQLSAMGGELRPGIVHRLDKATSGLIVVAKNDPSHRKLAAQFARRQVKKTYLALVHRAGPGHHRKEHPPRPSAQNSHDYAPVGRTRGHHPLFGGATNPFRLRQVHFLAPRDRYRPHPSDPGSSGFAGASRGRGCALRSPP